MLKALPAGILPRCTVVNSDVELLAPGRAVDELGYLDNRQAKIVGTKVFGGLSAPEVSEALGISRSTVNRDWAVASVWLRHEISRTA
jgi:RNA polymerase sigma-70 factor (ECF subfamily)